MYCYCNVFIDMCADQDCLHWSISQSVFLKLIVIAGIRIEHFGHVRSFIVANRIEYYGLECLQQAIDLSATYSHSVKTHL